MKDEIVKALAAASQVVNDWLTTHHPLLSLELENTVTIKATVSCFVHGARRRKVFWRWEDLYYRHVRHRKAWLFSLRRGEQPVALCLGTISISADHVALECLERRPYVHGVRGAVLAAAYRFALTVASALGLGQVRINTPLNDKLARFYARTLDMTAVRQTPGGRVNYLYRNVKS